MLTNFLSSKSYPKQDAKLHLFNFDNQRICREPGSKTSYSKRFLCYLHVYDKLKLR